MPQTHISLKTLQATQAAVDHQDLYHKWLISDEEKRFHCVHFPLSIDDDENEEDDSNEAEQAGDGTSKEDQTDELSGSVSAGEEESVKGEDEEPVTSGLSPISNESNSQMSPLSDLPSPRHSPSQSEPMQTDNQRPLSNGDLAEIEEPVDSSNHVSVVLISTSKVTKDPADVSPVAANGVSFPLSPAVTVETCDTQTNGTSPPASPRTTRSQKRKREEITSGNSRNTKHIIIHDRYCKTLLA